MLEECKMFLEEMDSGKKFIIHEWMWRVLEKITTVLYFVAGCDFPPFKLPLPFDWSVCHTTIL